MFEPKATAPHLDSTIRVVLTAGRSLPVFPLTTDVVSPARLVRSVPDVDSCVAARYCTLRSFRHPCQAIGFL
jgi:hypothetical protein